MSDLDPVLADVQSAIRRRRACRDFLPDPVSRETLELLVAAAQRAPTASNVPYRHVMIVDDLRVIRAVRMISAALLANPPALLILAIDIRMAIERVGRIGHLSSAIDSGAAGENVWLLATQLGLGTQFTMVSSMAGIRAILDLPEHLRVDLIMPVGLPAPVTRTKALPRTANPVYVNQYGTTSHADPKDRA